MRISARDLVADRKPLLRIFGVGGVFENGKGRPSPLRALHSPYWAICSHYGAMGSPYGPLYLFSCLLKTWGFNCQSSGVPLRGKDPGSLKVWVILGQQDYPCMFAEMPSISTRLVLSNLVVQAPTRAPLKNKGLEAWASR